MTGYSCFGCDCPDCQRDHAAYLAAAAVEIHHRDPEEITIGLIEGMIATARILARRYLSAPSVVAALKDLANDPDVRLVLAYADMSAVDQIHARMDAQSRTMDSLLDDADRATTALTELESRIADQESRIADQEAEIARLRGELESQSRVDASTFELASALYEFRRYQVRQIEALRVRVAGLEARGLEKRFDLAIGDLSFASTRQDGKIEALEAKIADLERRLAAPML